MNQDRYLAAACGLNYNYCEQLGDKCRGCGQMAGKPFWTEEYRIVICPIYGCCINEKQLEHCGLWDSFPARRSDPSVIPH